jgi:uncharacterized protein YndB with AHSA1/START domain
MTMTCAYNERPPFIQTRSLRGPWEEWRGPNGFTLLSWEVDFRLGGTSRLRVRSPEGRDQLVEGVQLEIVEPERVVFSSDPAVEGLPETAGTLTFRRA